MIISLNKELMDRARKMCQNNTKTSTPYLQRCLKIDFKTANKISAIFKEESNMEKGIDWLT